MSYTPNPSLAAIKRQIARLERQQPVQSTQRIATGHPGIDTALGGGLVSGRLHDVYAVEPGDAAAASGFVSIIACLGVRQGPIVWLREAGAQARTPLHPAGLAELGLDPGRLVIVVPKSPLDLLRAAAEVLRCTAVSAAVIELWHQPRVFDLTANRRLMMAAETSGVTALLLRIAVIPVSGPAQTRWRVAAGPSVALAGAPGFPAFDLELIRQRGGPEGLHWQVAWDRDTHAFANIATPLLGPVVSLAEHRPPQAGGQAS